MTSTGFERARKQLNRFLLGLSLLPLLGAQSAYAQAKLRLTDTALGPISVSTGSNGQTQTIVKLRADLKAAEVKFAPRETRLADISSALGAPILRRAAPR